MTAIKASHVAEPRSAEGLSGSIKRATEALYQAIQTIGSAMYGQGGAPGAGDPDGAPGAGPQGAAPGGPNGGEDVVEGEFKEA